MKKIVRFLLLFMAAIVYSAGVSLFLDPNDLAPGGVTGISILLNRLIRVETGTLILVLNIPIMILGIWKFGWKLIASTVYMLLLISAFTNLFSEYVGGVTNDRVIAAVLGGSLVAIGMGVTFLCRATTGGIDIIIKILRLRFRHLKTGSLFLMIDFVIVSISGIVFMNIDNAVYAMISVFISTNVLDMILYGRDEAKIFYIMSNHAEKITARILLELGIGATYLNGIGAYHKQEKQVVFCVMRKQLTPRAIHIVQTEDPDAFLVISSANEIFGEGYKKYNDKGLL